MNISKYSFQIQSPTLQQQNINMPSKISFSQLKKDQLISEKDIGSTIFRLYENRIYHVEIKKGERVTMDVVKKGYLFLKENGGGAFFNVFEFHAFSDVDPNVREWCALPSNNKHSIIDAIVINSLSQRILADFYVRFNRPIKPTRIFTSVDSAYAWVREVMKESAALSMPK